MKKLSLVLLLCCISIAGMAQSISGSLGVCAGSVTTLIGTPSGGTWTSGNVSVATVGSSSGAVTGVTAGTAVITYHPTTGGTAMATINVNPTPIISAGTYTVSVGGALSLTGIPSGGAWMSSTPTIGTVSTFGIVTGLAAGTVGVSYIMATGCAASVVVTVTGATNERGLNFDGENDYVYISGGVPSAMANVTYEAWVKPDLLDGNFHAIINNDAFTSGQIHFQFNSSNELEFAVPGANPSNQVSSYTFSAHTWYHVAAVYSSTSNTLKIYVNGSLVDNLTYISSVSIPANQAYSIGGWYHGFIDRAFGGTIDEVRIWDIARTATQISSNKDCDIAQNSNLKAYFRFNQGTAGGTNTSITHASDFSGLGNCGTLNNFSLTGSTSNFVTGNIGTCDATANANVNAGTISGGTSVAVMGTLTLTPTISGGSWSASNSNATVSSTGVVTGAAVGSVTISYAVTNSCGTGYATKPLTITSGLGAITGTTSVCVGATTTLSNSTTGGYWSTSTASVATVGAATGIVTGVANGTATITYTVGTTIVTAVVTVNPPPPAITGATDVCVGVPATFTDGVSGGSWSVNAPTVATISSAGVLNPLVAGTVITTYTLPTGCYTTLYTVVHPLPSATSGPTNVCVGANITLVNTSFGGVYWASSNPSVATIGSASGVVTGVSAGTAIMTYNLFTGCITTTVITVNPGPGAITGTLGLCVGGSSTLSGAISGGAWTSSNTTVATIGASTGTASAGVAGTATISYTLPTGCRTTAVLTVNTTPGSISGTTTICSGTTVTLTNSTTGGSWSSSNTSVATAGAGGSITGVGTGTATIYYTLSAGCSAAVVVTVTTALPSITGPSGICTAIPSTLSDATPGGTWSSSNTAVATIISGTGVVTGVTPGSVNITYTYTPGCKSIATFTVNPTPPTITGASSVCVGQTTTYSNTSTGGSWSSGNTARATVDAGSGVITGVGAGTVYISYTLSSGCYSVKLLNVNGLPAAITGPSSVCAGSIITLSDATTGGMSWTTSNTSIASVTAGGIVSGVSAGSVNITYTLSTGCFTTAAIIVNPIPSTISGSTSVCVGLTSTLTDADAGGTWAATPASIATIGSATGVLTGVTTGSAVVTYTLPTGCKRTASASVISLPSTISGPATVCVGSTAALTDATSGGTWSSSSTTLASVDASTGVVSGVATGSAVITYTVGTGCYRVFSINVTSALPSITGPTAICTGIPTTYTISAASGTWSSSNTTIATITSGGVATGVTAGSANITYAISAGCRSVLPVTVSTAPPAITGSSSVCIGSTTTFSNSAGGGTWSSSTSSVASVGSSTGIVTGVATGSAVITYNTGAGCYVTKTIVVNAIPSAITGSSTLCVGSTTIYTDITSGGMAWTSSNTSIASVGSLSGVVSGVSAGTATITYTLTTGCYITKAITINPLPATISGSPTICTASSITLTDADAGGSWSTTSTGAITVGGTSGVVSGVSTGTAVVTYTLSTGCRTTKTVTVIASPATITGPSSVCVGSAITYMDATAGGVWSDDNATVMSMGTSTGIGTGLTTGTVNIQYTAANGCVRSLAVTVAPISSITGTLTTCTGATAMLSHSTSGGVWSSSATSVATVGAGTGVVTGVTAGTATITYAISSGCFATATITVNSTPTPTTGPSTVCIGSTITLSNATGGGSWTSGSATVASVDASGTVTGNSVGSTTISYILGSGCVATKGVSVSPTPAAITGNTSLCVTTTTLLTDASGPGTGWSSSDMSVATAGIISGVITGVTPGTATITFTTYAGCIATTTVTVNPLPSAVTGSSLFCTGTSTVYSATPSGGTWSATPSSMATIDATTGIATGVGAGVGHITYTMGSGCISVMAVTVSVSPSAISGPTTLCMGSAISLSTTPTGGTWSSTNTSRATVGSSSGVVMGIDTGLVSLIYTLASGCNASQTVSVNVAVPAITGTTSTCIGLTTTLSTTATGGTWSSSNSFVAMVGTSGIVTGIGAGTAVITYTAGTGCYSTTMVTVNGAPSSITGTMIFCAGSTSTLSSASTGGSWTSANSGIATIDASTGVATGVNAGTVRITYAIGTSCLTSVLITVQALPAIISGPSVICNGSSATLSTTPTGGTWSSSATGVATILPTGVVTGVSTGTTTISYTLSTGCTRTGELTVNPTPSAITGTMQVCMGSTTTLSHTTSGGTWSSSNSSVASITSAAGIVTGVSAGTATITYTVATGCIVTTVVTVNSLPATITGNAVTCIGSITTFSSATSGGTWSTTDPAIADIDASTGVISGIAVGNTMITYTLSTGCLATKTVTVNGTPAAIGGPTSICIGATGTLYTTGGTSWTSGDPSVATIGIFSGVMTGIAAGTVVMTYNMLASCQNTIVVTVNTAPSAITGTNTLCAGATSSMVATPSGGTWSSSNAAIATVGTSGVVTAVSAGTARITYNIGAGCYSTILVSVNPAPAAITGATTVCFGQSGTLTSTSTGGTWGSDNVSVATVGLTSGLATSVSTGTANITYTLSTGCMTTTIVTVTSAMAAITGTPIVCVGLTTTLSHSISGGSWTSSNLTKATVNASTGVVTGISGGTATISYAAGTGCVATQIVTVTTTPAPITGVFGVCQGNTTTLSDADAGGTWASSNPIVATVDVSTGTVSGLVAGSTLITYALSGGCKYMSIVTVNATPTAISGVNTMCVGSAATLGNTVSGGIWSSSASTVASISSTSGVVTALATGTTDITYMLPSGCMNSMTMTVNAAAAAITGSTSVCPGSTIALSHVVSGGAWASSASSVASVDHTSGLVTGVSAGTTNITYFVTPGCMAVQTITVNSNPSPISGMAATCVGSTTTLSATPSGGTWSSGTSSVASIDASTGMVSGLITGTTLVSYTLSTGCASSRTVTVNPPLAAITGIPTVCVGSTSILSISPSGGLWTSSNTAVATIGSISGVVTGNSIGTSTVTFQSYAGCISTVVVGVTSAPTPITGSLGVCVGSTSTLSSTPAGGVWTSSTLPVASVNSATGVVTGVAAGASHITYSVGSGCFSVATVTVNSIPGVISGTASVCVGATATLSSAPAGGTWSSADITVATVGSTTGIVTGAGTGATTISYTLSNGCSRTTSAVVSAGVPAITGTMTVCAGLTTLLSNTTTGGAWTSSNTTVATVSAGTVTGITGGTARITYSTGTGCFATTVVTVTTLPSAITGTATVCQLSTTTLSDADAGGLWSSSNAVIAAVDAAGVVTGNAAGMATITYALTPTCRATRIVTVNTTPSAITGTTSICNGSVVTLSSSPAGGTWSSASPAVATISATGVLTGVGTGMATISYTLASGCARTAPVTVSSITPITGNLNACNGLNTILSDVTPGGTWTTSNGVIATVSSGIVTPHALGTVNITYSLSAGCYTTAPITVNALPAVISGPYNVCAGQAVTIVEATPAGTWSSSNTSLATIDASTGLATGVAAGPLVITYTLLSNGCYRTTPFTVKPLPAAIAGNTAICVGGHVTVTDPTSGGASWVSSNASIASIGFTSGVVTGVGAGTATITYNLATGCYTTKVVTVSAAPDAGTVSGPSSLSISGSMATPTFFTDPVGTGAWSSSDATIATINSSTGQVLGVSAGGVTISYTYNNGCGVAVATAALSITSPRGAGNNGEQAPVTLTNVMLYPNPTNGTFTINAPAAGTFTMFTLEGKEVKSFMISEGANALAVPAGAAAGIYMCRYNGTDGTAVMVRLVYEP